jgi:hypothetical protein
MPTAAQNAVFAARSVTSRSFKKSSVRGARLTGMFIATPVVRVDRGRRGEEWRFCFGIRGLAVKQITEGRQPQGGDGLVTNTNEAKNANGHVRFGLIDLILRGKTRNAFGHSCDITRKALADGTMYTEGHIAVPSLHSSQVTPVQSAPGGEIPLGEAQEFPSSLDTASKYQLLYFLEWHAFQSPFLVL